MWPRLDLGFPVCRAERINSFGLSHRVCGDVLWQPWETETVGEKSFLKLFLLNPQGFFTHSLANRGVIHCQHLHPPLSEFSAPLRPSHQGHWGVSTLGNIHPRLQHQRGQKAQDQLCRPGRMAKPSPAPEKDKAKVRKQVHRGWGRHSGEQHGDRSRLFSEPRAKKFTFPLRSHRAPVKRYFLLLKKKEKNTELHAAIVSACPRLQTTTLATEKEFLLPRG